MPLALFTFAFTFTFQFHTTRRQSTLHSHTRSHSGRGRARGGPRSAAHARWPPLRAHFASSECTLTALKLVSHVPTAACRVGGGRAQSRRPPLAPLVRPVAVPARSWSPTQPNAHLLAPRLAHPRDSCVCWANSPAPHGTCSLPHCCPTSPQPAYSLPARAPGADMRATSPPCRIRAFTTLPAAAERALSWGACHRAAACTVPASALVGPSPAPSCPTRSLVTPERKTASCCSLVI